MTDAAATPPPSDTVPAVDRDTRRRIVPGLAIPQLAVVAPLVAFAVGGTAVPIPHATEQALQVATWPTLVLVAWSLWVHTRLWRSVSGIAMILWWGAFLIVLLGVDHPRTSAFGVLTIAAIPIVIAFTWAKPWGRRDMTHPDTVQ